MSLYQLIYKSRPTVNITDDVLLDILHTAQDQNYKLQISGLLVFHRNAFMQLLEGEENQVKQLYIKIQQDPRHTDTRIVLESTAVDRAFPLWTMGFGMSNEVDSIVNDQNYSFSLGDIQEICSEMNNPVGREFLAFLNT